MRRISVSVLLLAAACTSAVTVNSRYGKVVERCTANVSKKHVWIFKQRHQDVKIDTQLKVKSRDLPQYENQHAIYQQLDDWAKKKFLSGVVAEGCEGDLEKAPKIFNGWTLADLKQAAVKPEFDEILTSVPFKLEAKYGADLLTTCGDDEALIRENLLAVSDQRGTVGYLLRLVQYSKDPVRVKLYLDGAIETFKMPAGTTVLEAIERLKVELKKVVARMLESVEKRNAKVVETVFKLPDGNIAVVFGGLHASGLVKLLNEKGLGCSVVEPAGYKDDERQMLQELDALLSK